MNGNNKQLMFAISNNLSKSEVISFARTMDARETGGILLVLQRTPPTGILRIENDG